MSALHQIITGYAQGGGATSFNPLTRFAGGKQGILVDLNDLTSLWQDTARTVAVTAVGQTVKGITDKSGNGNHLNNATGWVLTADGVNNYLQTGGSSRFITSAFSWGSDKASLFFGVKKDSGTTSCSMCSFGAVGSQTGSFDLGYFNAAILLYRRGSGSFGGRAVDTAGNNLTVVGALADLSGTTQATENPFLTIVGAQPTFTEYGAADSGTGNFGTYAFYLGDGQATLPGRIYSFFVVADTSTQSQMDQGSAWCAARNGTTLANAALAAPLFLDTGVAEDMGTYKRTSAFAHADYQTTATQMLVALNSTSRSNFPTFADLGVFVNGTLNQVITPPANGAYSKLIFLPAGNNTVSFRNGLTSSPTGNASDVLGTFFVSASGNASATGLNTSPTNRIVIYGDSIAVGGNATTPVNEAWPVLLRAYAPNSIAMEAYGYRSLYKDGADSTARAAFVAKIQAYSPAKIWLCIGTNDYGLNYWNYVTGTTSPVSFGSCYGATLDALHAAMPSLVIYVQTPIARAAGTNSFSQTLQDYRDAITTEATSRSAWVTLVDGTAFLTTSDLDDGTHPTTAGHAKYAAAVKTVLGL
jgi:lysophospholipase L1-like esterase